MFGAKLQESKKVNKTHWGDRQRNNTNNYNGLYSVLWDSRRGAENSTWGVGEVLVQGVAHLIWVVRHE